MSSNNDSASSGPYGHDGLTKEEIDHKLSEASRRDQFVGTFRQSSASSTSQNLTNPFASTWTSRRQNADAEADLGEISDKNKELSKELKSSTKTHSHERTSSLDHESVKDLISEHDDSEQQSGDRLANQERNETLGSDEDEENEDEDADTQAGDSNESSSVQDEKDEDDGGRSRSLRHRQEINMNVDHLASMNHARYPSESKSKPRKARLVTNLQAEKEKTIENDDICSACLRNGTLLCCERCTRSYHPFCTEEGFRNAEDAPDDLWICKACRLAENSKKHGKNSNNTATDVKPKITSTGFWKSVAKAYETGLPRSFELPRSITKDIYGVIEHPETGEYVNLLDVEVVALKNKHFRPQWEHPFGAIKLQEDEETSQNVPLCYKCNLGLLRGAGQTHFGNSSEPDKPNPQAQHLDLIKCDYCPLYWHLDCLDIPSCTLPPAFREKDVDVVDVEEYRYRRDKYWKETAPRSGWDTELTEEDEITGTYAISKSVKKQQNIIDEDVRVLHIRSRWACPCHSEWAAPYMYRIQNWRWLREHRYLFEEASRLKSLDSVNSITGKEVTTDEKPDVDIKKEEDDDIKLKDYAPTSIFEVGTRILGDNKISKDMIIDKVLKAIGRTTIKEIEYLKKPDPDAEYISHDPEDVKNVKEASEEDSVIGKKRPYPDEEHVFEDDEDMRLAKKISKLEKIKRLDNSIENQYDYLPINTGKIHIENSKHTSWYFRSLNKTLGNIRKTFENGEYPTEKVDALKSAFNAGQEFVYNGTSISVPDESIEMNFLRHVKRLTDIITYDNEGNSNQLVRDFLGDNLNPETKIGVPGERVKQLRDALLRIDRSQWDIDDIDTVIRGLDGKGKVVNKLLFNSDKILESNYSAKEEANESERTEVALLPPHEAVAAHNKRYLNLLDVDTMKERKITEKEAEIFCGGLSKLYGELNTFLEYRKCKKMIYYEDIKALKEPVETPEEYKLDPKVLEGPKRKRGRQSRQVDESIPTAEELGTTFGRSPTTYTPAKSKRGTVVIDQRSVSLEGLSEEDIQSGLVLSQLNKENIKITPAPNTHSKGYFGSTQSLDSIESNLPKKEPIILLPDDERYERFLKWEQANSS